MQHIGIVEQGEAFHIHAGALVLPVNLPVIVHIALTVKYIAGMDSGKSEGNLKPDRWP